MMPANTKKNQLNVAQRFVATATLIVAICTAAINAHAHTPHDMVLALGVSPDYASDKTLFLATEGALTGWRYPDLLRSTDGGNTWTDIPNGLDHTFQYRSIRVSPNFNVDHTVYVATEGGGVYRSLNRGDSWQRFNTGIPDKKLTIQKLEIAGTDAHYAIFAIVNGNAVYRRYSTETAWTRVLSGTGTDKAAIIATSPNFTQDSIVMIADPTGILKISQNGGNSWTNLGNPTGGIIYDIAIAPGDTPGNAKEIFLATSNPGIFYSNDSGNTFINKLSNLPAEAINNVAVSPNYSVDRTVYCTTLTQSVYKSTDGGESWTLYDSGAKITKQTKLVNEFSELQVSNTFSTDQTVFLSAFDGLFVSTDGGTTWKQKQTRLDILTGLAISPNYMDDQRVIAISYAGGGIFNSVDSGATWYLGNWPIQGRKSFFDLQFARNPAGQPTAISAIAGFIGFSYDLGDNWERIFIDGISTSLVSTTMLAVSPNFHTDQEIFLGTRFLGVLRTKDAGSNWQVAYSATRSYEHMTSVVISPNYANDKTVFAANLLGEVWRTTNGGDTWSQVGTNSIISNGWPKQKYVWLAISPDFATDQVVLAGTTNGVYRTGNGGNSWEPLLSTEIGPGNGNVIYQIEFSPNFSNDRLVYVNVRGKGLYRIELGSDGAILSTPQNVGQWLLDRNIQFTEFQLSPSFVQDTTILGAARESIYLSRDGGFTWELAGHPAQ